MQYPQELVLVKTTKGNEEITSRKHGLNPRMRQLLILIDGHRSYGALSKMIGEKECTAFVETLERDGFIGRVGESQVHSEAVQAQAPVRELAEVAACTSAAVYEAPARTTAAITAAPTTAPTVATSIPVADMAAAPISTTPVLDFPGARRKITRLLSELLGPFADDISMKIEKTKTIDELRELLPAVASIVEAVRGKSAMKDFVQKVGRI